MTWLIDASGVPWPQRLHPIAQWDAAGDPVEYAISDLGFIHVRLLNGGATITFNPWRVSRTTMIAAFYLVAGEQPKRVVLSCRGECGCADLEIVGTVAEAFHRIEERVETHPSPIPVLARKRWSLDRPPSHVAEQVMDPLHAWGDAAGRWTQERQANLLAALPLKDLLIARNPCGTNRLVYDHWGTSFDFLGPRWAQIARGRDVEDQPFPELGKRSASLFRRTLADAVPCLDEIDIALSSAGSTVLRRRYDRLLLPWSGPDGDRYVTLIRFETTTTPS